jgi:hypothetical protein
MRDRRRYRETVSLRVRRGARVLSQIQFPANPVYQGQLLNVPSNLNYLLKCKKSGSWHKSFLPFTRPYIWTSKVRPYFVDLEDSPSTIATIPSFLESAQLELLWNCKITDDPKSSNSLNMYSSLVTESTSQVQADMKVAVFLDVSGAGSFQHFVQDCLPIISLIQDLPEIPKDIPIIVREPDHNFTSFKSYLNAINCQNPIHFLRSGASITVEKLFFLRFYPFNAIYSLPPLLYESTYSKFHSSANSLPTEKRNVILVNRHEKIRNFNDLEPIVARLEKWCKQTNLELKLLNPKTTSFDELQDVFSKTKYVFAVHGGANYNMIWAPPDATLIEFIPTQATDSLFHMTLSYGQNYLPYALPHDKGEKFYHVSSLDIDLIISYLDSIDINFDS